MKHSIPKKEKVEFEVKLEDISQQGVRLYIDGREASPREIVEKYYLNEEQIYMQDIVISDCGEWTEMHFDKVM